MRIQRDMTWWATAVLMSCLIVTPAAAAEPEPEPAPAEEAKTEDAASDEAAPAEPGADKSDSGETEAQPTEEAAPAPAEETSEEHAPAEPAPAETTEAPPAETTDGEATTDDSATDDAAKTDAAADETEADETEADETEADESEEEDEGGWDPLAPDPDDNAYVALLKREIVKIGELDIYGSSGQLPQGYFGIKYDWTSIRAGSRYDSTGKRGPVMAPIAFTEADGSKVIEVDLGLSGSGGGHTFQMSYGILDELDWYLELPFTHMKVSLNPSVSDVDDQGNKIKPGLYASGLGVTDTKAYNAADFIYDTLPKLGRASPATGYSAEWLLGDINTGFSWNYFRSKHISFAMTPRIYFPTGKVQDSNNSLFYGTGPAIETGIGGWAVGVSNIMDIRLFQYSPWLDIILTTEVNTSYGFPQERKYPTNFEKPLDVATQIDANSFPDLSNLDGTFSYTPGFSVSWLAQLSVNVAFVGFGFAYGIQVSQEPWLEGDPDFVRMAKSLELIGKSELQSIQVGATVSLVPLYVPLSVGFSYRHAVAGRNSIVFEDYYQVSIAGVIPVKPIIEDIMADEPEDDDPAEAYFPPSGTTAPMAADSTAAADTTASR